MNWIDRGPLGLKADKAAKDPAYLAKVRQLPCVICSGWGMIQTTPTEAHHVTHDRLSQRKTPDGMAIPLCADHHRGGYGSDKIALHAAKDEWRRLYGPDHEFSAMTQDAVRENE